MSYVEHYYSPP